MKRYNYEVNGKEVECITILGLAQMSNRSAIAIRKMIEKGILPEANFRGTPVLFSRGVNAGVTFKGQRLYSMELAHDLSKYIKSNLRRGSKVTDRQKLNIQKIFEIEREILGIKKS